MTHKSKSAAALVVFATVQGITPSQAVPLPYSAHREQNIDNHQVGYVDLTVNENGNATLTAKFSNGKQWSGNNFYAITALRAKDGGVLRAVLQEKGLDGSFGGRAREGSDTQTFTLTKDQLAALDHIDVQMGVRNCGTEIIEMHGLNDVTFSVRKCAEPAAPGPRSYGKDRTVR
jgi:hypothetical protein